MIQANTGATTRTQQARAVHDLRVAVRRFRTALSIFDLPLQGTSATLIQRQLKVLNRQLGPIRDAQVWLALARKMAHRKNVSPEAGKAGLRVAERTCAAQERVLVRILTSALYTGTLARCRQLLAIEVPRKIAEGNRNDTSRHYLAGKLHQAYDRLLQAGKSPSLPTTEAAHALRRRCRRIRYLSEFAEPLMTQHVPKLTRRLKRVADALGDWHDAEVHAAKLKKMKRPPVGFRRIVASRRQKARQTFTKTWRHLIAPRFYKHVLAELQAKKPPRK